MDTELIKQRVADVVVAGAPAGNVTIWFYLDKLDLLIRIGVGLGSFVLVCFALHVKLKQWGKAPS